MKPANFAPVYAAALYPQLAEIARDHGYALAVHGSLARDMDLIAVPWTRHSADPQTVVDVMVSKFSITQLATPDVWTTHEHGREVTTLSIGFGECFIDLSFLPRRGE